MGTPDAVTIADAAVALGVSKPRIHQLLCGGVLTGPLGQAGRAPRGALRVWRSSLESEILRRQQVSPPDGTSSRRKVSKRSTPQADTTHTRDSDDSGSSATVGGGSVAEVDAARSAVQQMKVALDLAREALRAERTQTRKVTRVLADTVALLEEQQRLAEQADAVADGYADALTQLVSPTDPSDA